ncbi:MAG TPA: penicillin-binding transpeptidase domain-containing protein [Thermoanaerobaculia bacterium]|jgi:beta-lactamase class D
MRLWLLPSMLCFAAASAAAQDLASIFKPLHGTFVLYDRTTDRYTRYDEARAAERFSPKSTFKIANSLIGLETGVIRDVNHVIEYDRVKNPPQPTWNAEPFIHWPHDQTLRSAFRYSVLWYYQELARRAGLPAMKQWVTRLGYGNRTVSNSVDSFWLDGSLKISANEQVEFLKALHAGKLPVSPRTASTVKEILLYEETPQWRLSGKTGGGSIREGVLIGWFVGYVETRGNVYFFATNIEGDSYAAIREPRIEATKEALRRLGVLPPLETEQQRARRELEAHFAKQSADYIAAFERVKRGEQLQPDCAPDFVLTRPNGMKVTCAEITAERQAKFTRIRKIDFLEIGVGDIELQGDEAIVYTTQRFSRVVPGTDGRDYTVLTDGTVHRERFVRTESGWRSNGFDEVRQGTVTSTPINSTDN